MSDTEETDPTLTALADEFWDAVDECRGDDEQRFDVALMIGEMDDAWRRRELARAYESCGLIVPADALP